MPRSEDGAPPVTPPHGAPTVMSPAPQAVARRTALAASPSSLRGTTLRRDRLAQPRHPAEQLLS